VYHQSSSKFFGKHKWKILKQLLHRVRRLPPNLFLQDSFEHGALEISVRGKNVKNGNLRTQPVFEFWLVNRKEHEAHTSALKELARTFKAQEPNWCCEKSIVSE